MLYHHDLRPPPVSSEEPFFLCGCLRAPSFLDCLRCCIYVFINFCFVILAAIGPRWRAVPYTHHDDPLVGLFGLSDLYVFVRSSFFLFLVIAALSPRVSTEVGWMGRSVSRVSAAYISLCQQRLPYWDRARRACIPTERDLLLHRVRLVVCG